MRLLTSLVGYERKKEKRKRLEVGPSKATQPTSSMLQKLLATQSALLDTTPQAAPHDKIDVLGLCPRGNLHLHKTSPISTKEVGKILNQYSSFTVIDPPLSDIGVIFPAIEQITMEVPGLSGLNFIANVHIRAPARVFQIVAAIRGLDENQITEMVL